jgi:hypothetical protein
MENLFYGKKNAPRLCQSVPRQGTEQKKAMTNLVFHGHRNGDAPAAEQKAHGRKENYYDELSPAKKINHHRAGESTGGTVFFFEKKYIPVIS